MNNTQMPTLQQVISSDGFKKAQNILYGKSDEEKLNICKQICKERGLDFNTIANQVQTMLNNSR